MRITPSILCAAVLFGIATSGVPAAPSPAWRPALGHRQTGRAPRVRSRSVPTATTCSANNAYAYFLGVNGTNNIAGGLNSAVVAGDNNEACDFDSAIAGGGQNTIGDNGNAYWDFIGAGTYNSILGEYDFIGAGSYNVTYAMYAGVGSGAANAANGAGSFIGGGGSNFYIRNSSGDAPPPFDGNVITGYDSFIGAGDLNTIAGNGSVVGGGGYLLSNGGAKGGGNSVGATDSFIGAGDQNAVFGDQSFLGSGSSNYIYTTAPYGVLGGGSGNSLQAAEGVIVGGTSNSIAAPTSKTTAVGSFIGGGAGNAVSADYAAVAGGTGNRVSGRYGSVAGGSGNIASGNAATVPGGYHNLASGQFSFAAGLGSYADTDGSFVWSDDSKTTKHLAATKPNQFLARAAGGVEFLTNAAATTGVKLAPGSGAWASASDRTLKSDVSPISDSAILDKVAALPVSEWSYTSERGVRHLGPMAQDFYAAFRVGEDDRHITSIDEDGVALAAIKALRAKDVTLEREVAELRAQVRALVALSNHR